MKAAESRFAQRIVLALVVAIMVACSWLTALDSAANQQVDAGLKRALLSFATARALNAIISVAQGTEIAVEPGDSELSLHPDRFSTRSTTWSSNFPIGCWSRAFPLASRKYFSASAHTGRYRYCFQSRHLAGRTTIFAGGQRLHGCREYW